MSAQRARPRPIPLGVWLLERGWHRGDSLGLEDKVTACLRYGNFHYATHNANAERWLKVRYFRVTRSGRLNTRYGYNLDSNGQRERVEWRVFTVKSAKSLREARMREMRS